MADAAQEGVNAFNARAAELRSQAAYNALARVYGPGAGAVETQQAALAAKAAETENTQSEAATRNALLPGAPAAQAATTSEAQARTGLTQTQNRVATTTEQSTAALRAAITLKGIADAGGDVGAAYDSIVAPNADAYGIDPAHIGPLRQQLVADPTHIDTIISGLRGAQKQNLEVKTFEDPVTHQQRTVMVDKNTGNVVDPGLGVQSNAVQGQERADTGVTRATEAARHNVVAEGQGQQRIGIAAANSQTGAFRAGTTANNSVYGAAPGASLPGGASAAGQPAKGTAAPGASPTAGTLFDRLPPKGKAQAIGQAQQLTNQQTVLQSSNAIMDQVDKQLGPLTAGPGALLKWAPGSRPKDLEANLQTLKSQGLMTWIQSMKNAQGQTGIGRVLQSEANAASALYGNMEQDQSPSQLAYHLKLFRQSVNKLAGTAQQAFKAQYGVDAQTALGGTAPAASTSTPELQDLVNEARKRGLVK